MMKYSVPSSTIVKILALMAGLSAPGIAGADVYAFIDESGIAHFSNVPQDKRYTLFLRTSPDAGELAPKLRSGNVRLMQENRKHYSPYIEAAATAHQLEFALLDAVISAESGYNPKARSHRGAIGLMQLMPATAKRYGVDPLDPIQNIRGGALYLRDLLNRFDNDLKLTLAAYNAGEDAVARYGNRVPPFSETRRYVPLVLDFYGRYGGNR